MYGEAMIHDMQMMDSLGWVFMLFFWILLFVGVIMLIRVFNSKSEDSKSGKKM